VSPIPSRWQNPVEQGLRGGAAQRRNQAELGTRRGIFSTADGTLTGLIAMLRRSVLRALPTSLIGREGRGK